MISEQLIKMASGRVDLFASEAAERWKADHRDAMACLGLEQTLALGIAIYDQLIALDLAIREAMLSREEASAVDLEVLDLLVGLIRRWLEPCQKFDRRVARFEALGFEVEGAEEFRKRWAEAKWNLKPADEAFDSPEMVALRDKAIDGLR